MLVAINMETTNNLNADFVFIPDPTENSQAGLHFQDLQSSPDEYENVVTKKQKIDKKFNLDWGAYQGSVMVLELLKAIKQCKPHLKTEDKVEAKWESVFLKLKEKKIFEAAVKDQGVSTDMYIHIFRALYCYNIAKS